MKTENEHDCFPEFVEYLIEKENVKDPDVALFRGVIRSDGEMVKQAIRDGANVNVTDKQLVNRYLSLHEKFEAGRNARKQDRFADFIDFLISEKNVNDPDVLFSQGVAIGNTGIIEKALQSGADPDVTEQRILDRYPEFYQAFCSRK